MKGSIFGEAGGVVKKVKPKTSKQILWEAAPKGDHAAIEAELTKVSTLAVIAVSCTGPRHLQLIARGCSLTHVPLFLGYEQMAKRNPDQIVATVNAPNGFESGRHAVSALDPMQP